MDLRIFKTSIITLSLAFCAFAQESDDVAVTDLSKIQQEQVQEETTQDSTEQVADNVSSEECDATQNPYELPCELMSLWNSMTIKQKAAQMVMVYMSPADFMIKNEFGGILVMKSHLKKLENFKENLQAVNSELTIPPLVAVDQEGGRVSRVGGFSDKWERTPSAKAMRNMPNDSIEAIAESIGAEMHSIGINMNLAPVLDPASDSRGKRSFMEESDRSWGSDTTNANKVRAFVQGMKRSGIICVSKHFPGYDSWTNSDHQIAVSATTKKSISKNIRFFKALADDIPVTMMSSVRFVRVSNRPAVFEQEIVNRARLMSPETVILTDDLWGVSLRAWVSGTERVTSKNYPKKDFRKLVLTALMAGNDMFMITYPQKAVEMVNYLNAISKQNNKYMQRVEESAARILKMKFKAGILKP